MIRRIDGETGLPLHAARKIKARFEKLEEEIRRMIREAFIELLGKELIE